MPSSQEIRQQFIDFFCKKHGHVFVPSSPVVPLDDNTLLFANAGMNQFKPYFLGTEKPKHSRVANTQKCIRAGGKHNDLDDVGNDSYHHTFFEMLGNWSFGDYFKAEAISWAWELLTEVWQLDPARLHVTVFEGDPDNGIPRDDEAANYWLQVGVPDNQIHLGNKKDNFWEMGSTGPCGPCTEVHYDSTPDLSGAKLVNAGREEVIEIWNNVFIQFNRNEDNSLTPLPAKHVDTGMGFERIVKVLQGKTSNYDTDIFEPLFAAIQNVSGAEPYTGRFDSLKDTAYRVIADHVRTLTFAITDGATIGNEGRDYVLRRILRRAARYGRQVLEIPEPFLHRLVNVLVEQMAPTFPELNRNPEHVRSLIYEEEQSFLRTLDRGIKLFHAFAQRTRQQNSTVISGEDAFKLHDTYGLLIDITKQMAAENGLTVDSDAYESEMETAKQRAREHGKKFVVTAVQGELPATDDTPKYGVEPVTAQIIGWVVDNQVVTHGELNVGDNVALLLDRTPFYAEQGGQVGDTGLIRSADGSEFEVEDTQRLGETVLHFGIVLAGKLTVGTSVQTIQSTMRRIDIMRNHTATHLLNLALRQTLGSHVDQKGSLVDDDKTRFDFSHAKSLSNDELRTIERRVNDMIRRDFPVVAKMMPLAEAQQIHGVRAVFGEKYPDPVRVVMIGVDDPSQATPDHSIEFCGGTHLPRTGNVGFFRIVSQDAVAKGVRRVTAVTGRAATGVIERQSEVIDRLTARFKCPADELPKRISVLEQELEELREQVAKAAAQGLGNEVDTILAQAAQLGETYLVIGQVTYAPGDAIRTQIDRVRQKAGSALIFFVTVESPEKVGLYLALTKDLTQKGIKAGDLIRPLAELLGGKGGGRPDLAQAGGKEPGKIPEALRLADELARKAIG